MALHACRGGVDQERSGQRHSCRAKAPGIYVRIADVRRGPGCDKVAEGVGCHDGRSLFFARGCVKGKVGGPERAAGINKSPVHPPFGSRILTEALPHHDKHVACQECHVRSPLILRFEVIDSELVSGDGPGLVEQPAIDLGAGRGLTLGLPHDQPVAGAIEGHGRPFLYIGRVLIDQNLRSLFAARGIEELRNDVLPRASRSLVVACPHDNELAGIVDSDCWLVLDATCGCVDRNLATHRQSAAGEPLGPNFRRPPTRNDVHPNNNSGAGGVARDGTGCRSGFLGAVRVGVHNGLRTGRREVRVQCRARQYKQYSRDPIAHDLPPIALQWPRRP